MVKAGLLKQGLSSRSFGRRKLFCLSSRRLAAVGNRVQEQDRVGVD